MILPGKAVASALGTATDSNGTSPWTWIFIVVALGIAAWTYAADRKRSTNVEIFARSLGAPYRRKPMKKDENLPIGCSLEQKGFDHKVTNILEAIRTDDLVLTIFDFRYKPSGNLLDFDDSDTTYEQTIVRMQSPLLKLPYFNLFPETLGSKLGKLFGGADINFPDAPAFSDSYILRGGNEAALRSLFAPALRDFIGSLQPLTIEGADDVLFVYRWRRKTEVEDLASLIAENKRLLALFLQEQSSIRRASSDATASPMGPAASAKENQEQDGSDDGDEERTETAETIREEGEHL